MNGLIQCCIMLCGLFIAAGCQSATANDIVLNSAEIRIPKGESRTFDLGTLPQKESTILLDVLARLDADSLSGSSYFMKITLNGQVINAAKTRTTMRITNKKPVSPVAPNIPASWFGNNAWRILYAPSFDSSLKNKFYEGDPYQTVLDVSDLVNPAGANKLEIINTCKYSPPKGSKGNYDLVLKRITIHLKPGNSPMMSQSNVDEDVINRGTPGAGPVAYTGQLLSGGGFSLNVANKSYRFGSRISYPNSGMNKLSPSDRQSTDGQKEFKIATTLTADGGQIIATGPDYQVIRTIRFTPRKVEVSDRITNLHKNAKLGVLFENGVVLEDPKDKVRLAGNPDNAINQYYSPGNPSVYVASQNHGLGLIIEDDIFRNQATLFFDSESKTAGMRTDKLCLQPDGTYTMRWSVYPVASNDYYDFINLVRNDWGANYTVEGGWTFFQPDTIIETPVEKVREQFTRLGISRACSWGGWVDSKHDPKRIGFGTGIFDDYWEDYRHRLKLAADKIHLAMPDCKVYVYYDTQRDTSEGGHERFKDSWLTNEKGAQYTTDWGGVFSKTDSNVATLQNSFGKAMLSVADRYLSELKVDGLYWDEMEAVGYSQPLITYNAADGYSCELDPETYTIKWEIGINTIMGEKHRIAVIDKVRKRGGDIMGNGPISTKRILELKPQRMVEIQHNEYWNYEGNLGSPLGYASSRPDFGNWIRALNMATLLVGTRYDYSYDISPFIFPFTPIELHAGYLLGKERIIATHSGNYGWQDSKNLVQVRYFDTKGKLTQKVFKTGIDNEARTEVVVEKGEAVVLVRLPVVVTPIKGTVTVHSVQYDKSKLRFVAESTKGLSVDVRTGVMVVKPRSFYRVKIGATLNRIESDSAARIIFDLPQTRESQVVEVTSL